MSEYFYIQLGRSQNLLLPLENTAGVVTLALEQICPIPGVAPALWGVANQQGKLLWVLELSALLGLQPRNWVKSKYNLTLVVLTSRSVSSTTEPAERQIGCVVSELKGIVALSQQQLQPLTASSLNPYLCAMAEIEQTRVAVLDVGAVFATLSNLDLSLVGS